MLAPVKGEGPDSLFKRTVRAAAATRGIYNDKALAAATERHVRTVSGWWGQAQPSVATLDGIADATGLSADELVAFVYRAGPIPAIPVPVDPDEDEAQVRAEAAQRSDRARPEGEGSAGPRAPHEKAGSAS